MKIPTLVVAVIMAVPVTVAAQSRFNTASPTYTPPPPANPAPVVIRDARTNGVQATVERNSQGQVIIRDYRTGRVTATVGR